MDGPQTAVLVAILVVIFLAAGGARRRLADAERAADSGAARGDREEGAGSGDGIHGVVDR